MNMEFSTAENVFRNITYESEMDLLKISPINQKRLIAFVNHFVTDTVTFFNTFAASCEQRMMDLEYKLQKVEASLLILEAQLTSIPDLSLTKAVEETVPKETESVKKEIETVSSEIEIPTGTTSEVSKQETGPPACEDQRFFKYFKMVKVGIPVEVVRMKMKQDNLDPNILDKPSEVIPGYSIQPTSDSNDSDSN